MNTSETVQAAQRLLAEREAVGLRKYGTTVDRTDLSPEQWLQHLIEELGDGLLYALRARDTHRQRIAEAEAWLQRCADRSDEHVAKTRPASAPKDAERRFGPIASDPADAERNIRAKEDAERAAYLARWKDAPEWARWLAEAADSSAAWAEAKPLEFGDGFFYTQTGRTRAAPTGVLGYVRCESRPTTEASNGDLA